METTVDRHRALTALAFTILFPLTACAADGDGSPSANVEREERGDTTIVRTLGGSEWGSPARLVEEVRIGRLDGPEEEMFGGALTIAPDRRGGVYVFDGQAPALRHYDAQGRYTRTLGRAGSGPGEYRDAALGLAVLEDGRVFMRDPRNARINIYDPSGQPQAHWPVASGLFTSRALVMDTAGHAWLKILTGPVERNKPWPIGLLHLDTAGAIVDTVVAPRIDGEPAEAGGGYLPDKEWDISPRGDIVVGLSGLTEGRYGFEVRRRDGSVLRIEKAHEQVAMHPEERAELEAINDWQRRNQGQFMTSEIPPVPGTKPAYRSFMFDDEGRIWVWLYMPAVKTEPGEPRTMRGIEEPMPTRSWREPRVFDVFESDGTYLGHVEVPERTSIYAIRGDELWAVERDEMNVPYVVRYRLAADVGDAPR